MHFVLSGRLKPHFYQGHGRIGSVGHAAGGGASMKRLTRFFLVAAVFFFLPVATSVSTRLENEVTVYMLSCGGERTNDICHGKERTYLPFTYGVSVDQHSVSYWTMSDAYVRRELPVCVVHDTNSWLCQWTSDEVPRTRFGMASGKYVEIATCIIDSTHRTPYQVSVWRWWLVRMREKFS